MIGLIRFIRIVVGVFGAWQVVGIANTLLFLSQNPEPISQPSVWLFFVIKGAGGAAGIAGFLWLRHVVNWLHKRKYQIPHPSLAKKRWAL